MGRETQREAMVRIPDSHPDDALPPRRAVGSAVKEIASVLGMVPQNGSGSQERAASSSSTVLHLGMLHPKASPLDEALFFATRG